MALKDIKGQGKAVDILRGIIRTQRIASSYVFCGESGVGKKTAAVNFAKALLCHRTAESYGFGIGDARLVQNPELKTPNSKLAALIDACDECASCNKVDSGTHPDFLLVSPEDRQIRIEEIRAIDDTLSYKPFESRKKVVIIDNAETMNISAANAFLKTLEEPPEDSIIILVSSKPDFLPATILSRCSRINFSPLSPEACRELLTGRVPEEKLDLAVRLSMGRPGAALSTNFLEERAWVVDLLKRMLRGEKDAWASREDMEVWIDDALIVLRDLAVLKITGDASYLINADLDEYLAGLSKTVEIQVIIGIHDELKRLRDLLLFNLNRAITWNYTGSLLRKELLK